MKWSWDWLHVVLLSVIIVTGGALVALGKGQTVIQVLAVVMTGGGVGALIKQSPRVGGGE